MWYVQTHTCSTWDRSASRPVSQLCALERQAGSDCCSWYGSHVHA